MKNIKKQILQILSVILITLGSTKTVAPLPKISLTQSAKPRYIPKQKKQVDPQQAMLQLAQQMNQQPNMAEEILDKLSFFSPNFISNTLFKGPIQKLIQKTVGKEIQQIPMAEQAVGYGINMAQWAATKAVGLALNLLTWTWEDGGVNAGAGLHYKSPLEALDTSNKKGNNSGFLRLAQAKGVREKLTKIPGLNNNRLNSGIQYVVRAQNAYLVASTLVSLYKLLSNPSQAMKAGAMGQGNPFMNVISGVSSLGENASHIINYSPTDTLEPENLPALKTLSKAMKFENLGFNVPATALQGLISAFSGTGLQWAMGNWKNIGSTTWQLAGRNESIQSIKTRTTQAIERYKLKYVATGIIAAAVAGLAIWTSGEDEAGTEAMAAQK
ncbi:hypothetical protein ACFLY6_02250 [Candidatus Dependentiae bacterium]